MKSDKESPDISTPKKSNFEAKILAIMAFIVLGGGAFLLLSNKGPIEPPGVPQATPVPKVWTAGEFDEIFKTATHVRGNANSPLKIIEFADAQCPSCRRTFDNFAHKFGKEIDANFAFMHYPISGIGHTHAIPCIIAMESASKQDKFWEMHEALFAKQEAESTPASEADLSDEFILKQAEKIGLNLEQFKKDLEDSALAKIAPDSEKFAIAKGITMTPTFLYLYKGKAGLAIGAQELVEQLKGYPGLPTSEELKSKMHIKPALEAPGP
jgi:protein-disulfide isomerase